MFLIDQSSLSKKLFLLQAMDRFFFYENQLHVSLLILPTVCMRPQSTMQAFIASLRIFLSLLKKLFFLDWKQFPGEF